MPTITMKTVQPFDDDIALANWLREAVKRDMLTMIEVRELLTNKKVNVVRKDIATEMILS